MADAPDRGPLDLRPAQPGRLRGGRRTGAAPLGGDHPQDSPALLAALLAVAVALGAVLYLAIAYLGGAAKVWTSIAAIAGSLGITARAVASTIARLTAEAERPILAMAEEDVMAWSITTMPPLRLGPRKVRQLRRAGIAPTSSLGRS